MDINLYSNLMKIDLRNKVFFVIGGHILYAVISILHSSRVDSNEEAGFVVLSHIFWLFSALIIFCILFFLIKYLVSNKKILPTFLSGDSFLSGLYVVIFLKIYVLGASLHVFTAYWILVFFTIALMAYVFYHLMLSNRESDGYAPVIFFVFTLLILSAYIDYAAMANVCSLDWVKSNNCRFFQIVTGK